MDPLLSELEAGARPSLDAFVEGWGEQIPLLRALRETPQDAEWHAEGDVHTHTQMVLDELYAAVDGQELSGEDRMALILGAVFHDIAKPLTTRSKEIDGRERIVSPRHADRGRSYLAPRLLELGMEYGLLRRVLALVGHHHDPRWLVLKDKPIGHYRRLARLADFKALYTLEQADLRGRICPDLQDQLDDLDLFRIQAEEHGLWHSSGYQAWREFLDEALQDQPLEFRDLAFAEARMDAEAGLLYTPEEALARSYKYRDGFAQLVVMCGISGSGKSTWAARHLEGFETLSLDAIREEHTGDPTDQSANSRVRQIARDRLKPLLQHHKKVVWDATNLRKDFRSAILQLGFNYGALVTLVVFHVAPEEAFARNAQRERQVPPKILAHQLDNFQWPYEDEAHRTLFVDKDGQILSRH